MLQISPFASHAKKNRAFILELRKQQTTYAFWWNDILKWMLIDEIVRLVSSFSKISDIISNSILFAIILFLSPITFFFLSLYALLCVFKRMKISVLFRDIQESRWWIQFVDSLCTIDATILALGTRIHAWCIQKHMPATMYVRYSIYKHMPKSTLSIIFDLL